MIPQDSLISWRARRSSDRTRGHSKTAQRMVPYPIHHPAPSLVRGMMSVRAHVHHLHSLKRSPRLSGVSLEYVRWVFEKVLISETRGPSLRNKGPIQSNSVSLKKTADEWSKKSRAKYKEKTTENIGNIVKTRTPFLARYGHPWTPPKKKVRTLSFFPTHFLHFPWDLPTL